MNVKPTTSDPGGAHDPQPGQTPGPFRRVWLGVRDRVPGSLLLATPIMITFWVILWPYSVLDR